MWPFSKKDTSTDPAVDAPWPAAQHIPQLPSLPQLPQLPPLPPVEPARPAPAPEPEQVKEEPAAPEHDQVPEDAPAPAPAPAPEHTQEQTDAPAASWITPTRLVVGAAIVPSVLSLVWLASTVAEITGGPGGWAAGVFADVLIVSTVLVAWVNADVRKAAGLGGWVAAVAAGVLLGWHHWGTEEVFFSLVPIGSKFLWHIALMARTSWEQRREAAARAEADRLAQEQQRLERERAEAQSRQKEEDDAQAAEAEADDDSLTVQERRQIAQAKRAAAFKRQLADAQAEEAKADIYAENTVLMARDQAEADRMRQRYELAGQVAGQLPIEVLAQFMPGLGAEVHATEVPHRALDRSRTEPAAAGLEPAATAPAGFGAALVEVSGRGVGTPADQQVPRVPTPGAHHSTAEAKRNRQVVLQALAAFEVKGRQVSIKALAEETGLSRRTVKRHLPEATPES